MGSGSNSTGRNLNGVTAIGYHWAQPETRRERLEGLDNRLRTGHRDHPESLKPGEQPLPQTAAHRIRRSSIPQMHCDPTHPPQSGTQGKPQQRSAEWVNDQCRWPKPQEEQRISNDIRWIVPERHTELNRVSPEQGRLLEIFASKVEEQSSRAKVTR